MDKFIFVSGGVCSSLGKGVAASSIGALLESMGLNVRMVKCDPYINVDAGTMNPYQHGEVYVTDDGAETDLDLGNYARFTKGRLSQANSITTGKVYEAVISKEREGKYQGNCVQVIPHITDEIKSRILAVAEEDSDTDVTIIEIGGTVGDIESIPFFEAARQLIREQGRKNAISVHLTLIPEVVSGELKTKPTQHSVKSMLETGIQPDILICRSPKMLDEATCRKIALFTNVDQDAVFSSPHVDTTIYQIPIVFFDQKLDEVILRKLNIENRRADMSIWHTIMNRYFARQGKIRIGIVGKYLDSNDTYTSLFEALFHASLECCVNVELEKIDPSSLEKTDDADTVLGKNAANVDGILVPGGTGECGINGMVKAAAWARENKKPYFGISLGMYVMIIDWVRNVIKKKELEEQIKAENNGRTMRLGVGKTIIKEGTHIMAAYGSEYVTERHRHCFVFTDRYQDNMTNSGLKLAAYNSDNSMQASSIVECIEWPHSSEASSTGHPWGVGVQFNPEFKSKPIAASPLFREFITRCNR
ncbi:MAG: CTP synthase [Treponema sp.]|jgi:CTP synthase|nr:CTP synthase [Treponema sp.]